MSACVAVEVLCAPTAQVVSQVATVALAVLVTGFVTMAFVTEDD